MGSKLSKKRKLKKRSKIIPNIRNNLREPRRAENDIKLNNDILIHNVPEVVSNINENEYYDTSDSEESSYEEENEVEGFSDSEESSYEEGNEVEGFSDSEESSYEEEKCFDPLDPTLIFVDGDDELDFEMKDFKGPRAKMSCGHAATPMSLTSWCLRQLDEGECKFVCGQTECDVEWSFEEVCKMALLTPEEMEYFEKKMFSNSKKVMDIKECPGCKSRVERNDPNNLNVECRLCTAAKGRTYRFCWQCLIEWKGPGSSSDRCENVGCQNPLGILRTCAEITFNDVKGVRGCPCIRACPTCGLLLEHNKNLCKSMVCPQCKVKFCFVCLSFSKNCLLQNAYECCPTGVAPRQTSIPVWLRR